VLAWLYTVVRNGALTAGRGEVRRRRREDRSSAAEAWFVTADDRIDGREAARLLAELPLEQSEVVVARIWGGLTFEEVAALVGCSLPTAHRRYQAGLVALRERLEGRWTPTPPAGKTI
jgi:DNA-directed RNA polymerase specialized sigma24 family protein